jgi:hypothetical protein
LLTTQNSLTAEVGTAPPAAAVSQALEFACGLNATQFLLFDIYVI